MDFIMPLLSIVFINLLLSGDNALVIALACRQLQGDQQNKAVFWGGAGAILLRLVFVFVVAMLLRIPLLQFFGGFLLLWIAVNLTKGEQHTENIEAAHSLWGAVKTIIVADVVMSLDNVLAIVGVAKGNYLLLAIGLGISIPIIIWGSKFIIRLMEKWPVIIIAGAAFLGWVGGEMTVADPHMAGMVHAYGFLHYGVPAAFAGIVLFFYYFVFQGAKVRVH